MSQLKQSFLVALLTLIPISPAIAEAGGLPGGAPAPPNLAPHEATQGGSGLLPVLVAYLGHHLSSEQADHLAVSLRKPEKPCRRFLEGVPNAQAGLTTIERLQRECEVSLTSAAIRYAELTSHLAAVLVSTTGKVDFCVGSRELVDYLEWDARIAKGSILPAYTPSRRLTDDSAAAAAVTTEDGEPRWKEWFGGHYPDDVFKEARGLGRYGKVLTVLTANG